MDNELLRLKAKLQQKEQEVADLNQQLKATQQALDKANFYLNNILLNLPEHIYWMDINEVVLGCNDKQAKSFGLNNKAELIGKSLQQIGEAVGWQQSMIDAVHDNNMEIIKTGKSMITEENAIFHGQLRTFLSYKNPLIDQNNRVHGILGITVDITERKQIEQKLFEAKEKAEQANKAKSEFLINMSHDVRTPLNGIIGFTEILKAREDNPEKKEMLDFVYESAMALFALLSEIMEIIKIEADEVVNFKKQFNLKELINDLNALMKTEAIRKNIKLIINISENIPDKLVGDKLKLHRILLNLISNALKFTDQGSITISVKVIEIKNRIITIMISIIDTGVGIPAEKLEAIFDRFTRLELSDRSSNKGIGLGLYIVKKFVEDLQGTIKVTSKMGEGTKFDCCLDFEFQP